VVGQLGVEEVNFQQSQFSPTTLRQSVLHAVRDILLFTDFVWLALGVGGHPALSLHSSNEPGELSQ